MRKVFTLILVAGMFVFSGCSVMDLFVDEAEVHNGLIQKLDDVLMAEEDFYIEYWALEDGSDTDLIAESYAVFETAVADLDGYFEDTRFASGQKVFVEEYEDYYKPFLSDYVECAGEFTSKVEADGFTYESMESYFDELDTCIEGFVDIHNNLIRTINTQADDALTGQVY